MKYHIVVTYTVISADQKDAAEKVAEELMPFLELSYLRCLLFHNIVFPLETDNRKNGWKFTIFAIITT